MSSNIVVRSRRIGKETQDGIIHHNEVYVCVEDAPRNDCEWWYGDELFLKIGRIGSNENRGVSSLFVSGTYIYIYQMMYHGTFTVSIGVATE